MKMLYEGGVKNEKYTKIITIAIMTVTLSACSLSQSESFSKNIVQNKTESTQINIKKNKHSLGRSQDSEKTSIIKETVNYLCSDQFQGRLTGSLGNKKAEAYIKKVFEDLEMKPLFGNDFYAKYCQDVVTAYGKDNCEIKTVNNVIGVIKGKSSNKAVVISAHFDHLGYVNGKLIRGALDNASGVSALIDIAHKLAIKSREKPFNMDIVFCAFNGEEEGLCGSRDFVHEITAKSVYSSLYNINIDCIGAKKGGKLALKNKSNISNKLYEAVKTTLIKEKIQYADTYVHGRSDNSSFELKNIPNIFIVQQGIEKLVHEPSDTPDILDFEQIDKISNALCIFVEKNDGVTFQN